MFQTVPDTGAGRGLWFKPALSMERELERYSMKVIPFPKKLQTWYSEEVIENHLLEVAQNSLDSITEASQVVSRDDEELTTQVLFVIDRLAEAAAEIRSLQGP